MSAITGYDPYSSNFAPVTFSRWHEIQNVRNCIAKVMCNHQESGCGILIGIDRLLVPFHVISGSCPQNLQVIFRFQDNKCSYEFSFNIEQFLVIDRKLDFCILQLSKDSQGAFPGNIVCIPNLSFDSHKGEFLLARFDGNFPSTQIEYDGDSCYGSNFCSKAQTVSGCSGSGYFDEYGRLFAMHLSRSSGVCGNADERVAIYLHEIYRSSTQVQNILKMPVCSALPPPQLKLCAPALTKRNICFIDEGKPAVTGAVGNFKYWEFFPVNPSGPGPRGISLSIPNTRIKVIYKFLENPHDVKAYNKNPEILYQNAAIAYSSLNLRNAKQFSFSAYNHIFTAVFEAQINYGEK